MNKLIKLIQTQFLKMSETNKLFRSSVTGNEVWDLYLSSFDNDIVFRDPKSSINNCNHCKNFIRRYGNIVAVDENNKIMTLWDIDTDDKEYSNTQKNLKNKLSNAPIEDVFVESFESLSKLAYSSGIKKSDNFFRIGVEKNTKMYSKDEAEKFGVVKEGEIKTFNHFFLDLPSNNVDTSGKSVEAIQGSFRDNKNVFQRGMEEISLDTLNLVKDLINQGSLLDGLTHLYKIEKMIPLKAEYDNLAKDDKNNWLWVNSLQISISKVQLAKFKNELIGVLCSELSEGEELNKACENWNKRVDPVNYMKVSKPITQRQIDEAKQFVEENGYTESFDRRFATIDDIKVTEILHSNVGKGEIKKVSIFDNVKSTSTQHNRDKFDGVEEVSIEKFMADILPTCTSIEAYLENRMVNHMVSLTTSNVEDSKPIFKWGNNYSWTFDGNLAGKSQIKENVKLAGGNIEAILRCSLQWNDADTIGTVDLDLHCLENKEEEIYYSHKKSNRTGGWLDVDMIRPSKIGIENISWQNQMPDGTYSFYVKNFDGGVNTGFKAEIELDGDVFGYSYDQSLAGIGTVKIATVTVKNGVSTITHHLAESTASKTIYGLDSNSFHKVKLVCLSPNHWGENNAGNKHYMFMLDDAKTDKAIRTFHNENLKPELLEHKRVLEVLASTTMIEPIDNQLSGLGFNATVKDELILKLQGSHKRTIKIKF